MYIYIDIYSEIGFIDSVLQGEWKKRIFGDTFSWKNAPQRYRVPVDFVWLFFRLGSEILSPRITLQNCKRHITRARRNASRNS